MLSSKLLFYRTWKDDKEKVAEGHAKMKNNKIDSLHFWRSSILKRDACQDTLYHRVHTYGVALMQTYKSAITFP